jgi:hypothetical protein
MTFSLGLSNTISARPHSPVNGTPSPWVGTRPGKPDRLEADAIALIAVLNDGISCLEADAAALIAVLNDGTSIGLLE